MSNNDNTQGAKPMTIEEAKAEFKRLRDEFTRDFKAAQLKFERATLDLYNRLEVYGVEAATIEELYALLEKFDNDEQQRNKTS